jgi:DNA-3-methyladenine glycosylase
LVQIQELSMPKDTPKPKLQSPVQKAKPLLRRFFDRDPRQVAQDLLGKLLIRRQGVRIMAGRIVETEAYMGVTDAAAHSAAGLTTRNAVLFGPPGYAYVYLIYGNHFCLNVSCMPKGDAGCVLFRALEPVAGLQEMSRYRHLELPSEPRLAQLKALTSGPGRMSQALAISRARDNGKDMTNPRESDLWLADDGWKPERVTITPRVGITKAMEEPLRFLIAGNLFVSGKRT